MLYENNPLLKLRLKKEKIFIVEFYKKITQSFFILFDLMLEKSSENFLVECFSILIGYFQLIIHCFDPIVRNKKLIKNLIIVLAYLEQSKYNRKLL